MQKNRLAITTLVLLFLAVSLAQSSMAAKGGKGKPNPPPDPVPTADPAIAFVNPKKAQVCVMDADGENATPVVSMSAFLYRPTLSPDGTRIAFEAYTAGQWGLWLVDAETGDATSLVPGNATNAHPAWSPDGKAIAYVHGTTEIRLLDPELRTFATLHRSVNGGEIHGLTFSPDGGRLAFVERLPAQVKVLDLITGAITVVHTVILGGDDRWEDLDWARTGDVLALNHSGMIATYDMTTGVLTELTAGSNPSWSPDDAQLVYESGGVRVYTLATGTSERIDRRGRWPDWKR